MDNPLEAALGDQPAVEAVTPEPQPAPETSAPEGPARGPDGKLVSTEADSLPASSSATAAEDKSAAIPPEAGERPEPGHVPLSSLLDEREKRQGAEKALRALQDRLEQERSDWQRQNPPTPEEQRSAERWADNLRISKKFAAREYGAEFVQTVHDWAFAKCDADPLFNGQMQSSDDPYEDAVQAYKREEILKLVSPGELDAFRAWQAAHAAQQAQQTTTPPSSAKASEGLTATQATPPRSLADAPGNGAAGASAVNVGEGEAFRAAIG